MTNPLPPQQRQRQILRAAKARGYSIQPTALSAMMQHGSEDVLVVDHHLSWYMRQHYGTQKVITLQIWNEMIQATSSSSLSSLLPPGTQHSSHPPSRNRHYDLEIEEPTETVTKEDVEMEQENMERNSNILLPRNHHSAPTPPNRTSTTTTTMMKMKMMKPATTTTNRATPPLPNFQVLTTFTDAALHGIPRFTYDVPRQQFQMVPTTTPPSEQRWCSSSLLLLGSTATDRMDVLAQRYALLYQRTVRHELFRPTSILHRSPQRRRQGPLKLTPIESLLGTKNIQSSPSSAPPLVLLFGILLQIEENVYYLEDMTGQIPVSFQHYRSRRAMSFYMTEHSILLVEGYYDDGILQIVRCGPPLSETRREAVQVLSQQLGHPAWATSSSLMRRSRAHGDPDPAARETTEPDISFLLLQDLYMDQPRIVQQFEALLSTYEFNYSDTRNPQQQQQQQLPIFVLMGNFVSSNPTSSITNTTTTTTSAPQTMKAILEELVSTIGKFTHLAKYGHFVIVPGPNDIAMTTVYNHHILPLPSFPKSMISGLQRNGGSANVVTNLHFTSNPCRIRFTHGHHHDDAKTGNQEMVIFRYDLLQLFQQHQIRLRTITSTNREEDTMNDDDNDDDNDTSSLSHHRRLLYKTILDQGCLVPISNVPIYWSCSHYLSLYPLPNCLVLADGSINHHHSTPGENVAREQYDTYFDCDIIQTISFSSSLNESSSKTTTQNNGAHTIYRPTTTHSTTSNDNVMNEKDDLDSDTTERIVEFGRIG